MTYEAIQNLKNQFLFKPFTMAMYDFGISLLRNFTIKILYLLTEIHQRVIYIYT